MRWPRFALACLVALAGCVTGPMPRDGATDSDATGGDRCATARLITDSTSLPAQQIDPRAGGSSLCDGQPEDPAAHYTVRIPAGLTALVTAVSPGGAALTVRLASDCAGSQCLAMGVPPAGAPAVLAYTNPGSAAIDAPLVVAAPGATAAVAFDLTVALISPPRNLRCNAARGVNPGERLMGVPTVDATERDTTCLPTDRGGLMYYQIDVPAGATLHVTARAASGDTVGVRVFDQCDGLCLHGAPGVAQWRNGAVVPRTVTVAVGTTSPEPTTLDLAFDVIPPGGTCITATALAVPSTTVVVVPSNIPSRLCDGAELATRWYTVRLLAGQRLTATVTGAPGVTLRASLGACGSTCVGAASTSGMLVVPEQPGEVTVRLAASAPAGTMFSLALSGTIVPPSARCVTAPRVESGTTIRADPPAALDRAPLCVGSDVTLVRANFYTVEVPPGHRVAVSTPYGFVRLLAACDSATCIDGRVEDGIGRWSQWANTGTTTATVRVAVSPLHETSTLPVEARVDVGPFVPPSRCSTAPTLTSGVTLSGLTTDASEESARGCGPDPTVLRTLWYRITVPAGQRLQLVASGGDAYALRIALRDGCASAACLPSAVILSSAAEQIVNWDNTGTADRTVTIAVAGSGTPFNLLATVGAVPLGGRCASPTLLVPGTPLTAQRFTIAGEAASSCAGDARPAVFYRVAVPAGQRLEVTVDTLLADPLIRILSACDATSCLGTALRMSGARWLSRWLNTSATSREVLVAVSSGYRVSSGDAFGIAATLVDPPANARCSGATLLTPGVTVTGNTGDAGELAPGYSLTRTPSLFYAVDVPAGQRVRATETHDTLREPSVRIIADCAASTVLGRQTRVGAYWANTGSTTRRVLVVVSSPLFPTTVEDVPFRLTASLETPPANGRCASSLAVTPNATLTDQHSADAVEFPVSCDGAPSTVPSLYYSVAVPSGQRLTVRATYEGGYTSTVAILDACGGACLARQTSGHDATWANGSAATRTVVVALLAAVSGAGHLTHSVGFALAPVPPGGLCSSARSLALDTSQVRATSDAGQAVVPCGSAPLPLPVAASFDTVVVPAGRTVRVTQTSTTGVAAQLRAFASCDALDACLAVSTHDSAGNATLRWTNSGTTDATIVVASGWLSALRAPPSYALAATLEP